MAVDLPRFKGLIRRCINTLEKVRSSVSQTNDQELLEAVDKLIQELKNFPEE